MPLAAVRLTAVSLGSLVLAVAGIAAAWGQGGEVSYSIFPPAPRELRQHVSRAEAAITDERFSDAVAELGQVLNSPQSDDFFLGTPGDSQVSLKTQALALLGSMPERGRRLYELQFGADARAALDQALKAGDFGQLTEVCRRYFHTKAGYEATLLVGRIQLDQGRPLAAALTLKRVADVPSAAAEFDPELSVLLATCWLHAGRPEQASETLLALKQRLPTAKVRLVDRETGLFSQGDEALPWLESIVGGPRGAGALALTEWIVHRGNEARNARSLGGVPLLNFTWKVPAVNNHEDLARVAQLTRSSRDSGEPLVSSLQPIVVKDYAVVRQPETGKLIGMDLKRQGRRVWVFPPFDDYPAAASLQTPQVPQLSRNPNLNIREQELKQRVWDDHAFGQVSSDGNQVYVIDKLGYAAIPNAMQQQMRVFPGGRIGPHPGRSLPHNVLVAVDLAREGAQVWGVGGERGDDNPAMAGAFFLGPPLPLGDQLYALAEFNGEIRLVCLSAKSGALEWKQQLAVLDEGQHILYDTTRRLAGASPSYADGVLICPTSAGAVVAVDLATRTLRWGYQYPRWDVSRVYNRRGFSSGVQVNSDQGRWLDASATVADGAVILTPPESRELHCLDLLTGKPRWPSQPRDEYLFVACVHDGKIILVGNDARRMRIKAVNLSDGKPAWAREIDIEGTAPSGRGYYSGKHYFLPVTDRELLKVDLEAGTIESRAQTEIELGNLVAYQDQLISVSPQYVASFVLLSESLQQKLQERLAANPDDVEALALKGQILLQKGQADESLALLRRAHKLSPDTPQVRELLVKVMLALLRQDLTAHLELTDELDKLVTDPAQRREVLRWRILGLARGERTGAALSALFELADYELTMAATRGQGALDTVDRELSVRADRWIQGQLYQLYKSADSAAKERIGREIEARIEPLVHAAGTPGLRAALDLFGFHERSDAARLALADRLIEADALLEAEFLVGELLEADDVAVAGAAHAALAAVYEKARRPELAARQYAVLAERFGEVVCRRGQTGRQLHQQGTSNPLLKPWLTNSWPLGEVEVQRETPGGARMTFQRQVVQPVQIGEFYGAAPRGLRAWYDPSSLQISVRSDTGQQLVAAPLRTTDITNRLVYSSAGPMGAKAHGHLFVVSMPGEIIAVDALREERETGGALLWRQETGDLDPRQRQAGMFPRPSNNPLVKPFHSPDSAGLLATGPIAATGLCFQKGRQLHCIDPLTGQPLWERGQMPQPAAVFGDREFVFVAEPDGQTLVLSAIDGSLIDKLNIDQADRRWITCGRNVLAWQQRGATVELRLYDAVHGVDPQHELWSRRLPPGSKGAIIDGEELALLEPGGQFTVVSLADGQTQFSVPLAAEPSLSWIEVLRSREQYLLMACQDGADNVPNVRPQGIPPATTGVQTPFQGRVYAFSRATGKLQWHSPAHVSQQCLAAEQPTESPLLLFACTRPNAGGSPRGNNVTTAVLALDRRDGRVVHTESVELSQLPTQCDIAADRERQTVSVRLGSASGNLLSLVFKLTDKPIPPQPPAENGEMAAQGAGRPPGTVDPSVGAAIERLNRGADPRALFPPARPQRR